MATIEEQKDLAEQIKTKLQQFSTLTLDELTRELELGNQLSFKKGEQIFIRVIDLFKRINPNDLFEAPHYVLVEFQDQLDHVINAFQEVKKFDTNISNPAKVRDELISRFENQYDSYFQKSLPILTLGLLNTNDSSIEKAKLGEVLNELIKEKDKAKDEASKMVGEIQEVLSKARQAAVEVGVSQHYRIFKEESEEHKQLSDLWLKRTINLLIAIGIFGILLLFVPTTDSNAFHLIQFTVTKIVILSVLFYGLSICVKNYKAHKHNSILNKHRQNALNTFETFSKAAGDDNQTKNAVLLEATHTIFSNQRTGYLGNDSESDSPNKIIEIIKNTVDKSQ